MSHGKKLTKRAALILCIELWQWLERNARRFYKQDLDPVRIKSRWPKFEDDHFIYDCPCCEYTLGTYASGRTCQFDCPLRVIWPKGCDDKTSPYRKWRRAAMPKYAKMIWEAAAAELKKMDAVNKKRRAKKKCLKEK